MNMTLNLNGSDWRLSGWMRHQWKMQKLMETDSFSLPVVLGIPATVPGAVQADLLRAGVIEDWNVGDNFLHMEWVEHREWVYEKHFSMGQLDATRYELCFEGLDYSGYIFLNGVELSYFEGMHLPHTVDVTSVIREGDNHLRLVFLQPPEVEGQVGYTSRVKTLKSRYNYGWDWMPRMVNIGIFGDVTLKIEQDGVLGDVYPHTTVTDGCGILKHHVTVEHLTDVPLTVRVSVYCEQGELLGSAEALVDGTDTCLELRLPGVDLWQVNGFGEQPLYSVRTELYAAQGRLVDMKLQTVGFRSLSYTRPSGAAEDSFPYVPVVNGYKIPVRGVNWVPLSPFYGTVTPKDYDKQLTAFRDMGVTVIRVWGGALLESQAFYDTCDRLGLLVWQEFPQSSSGIENAACADPDFIEDICRVARVDILRRRSHACLAFWCGGNELYYDDYKPQGLEHPTLCALAEVVKELDGDRLYLPASPSGPVPGSMDYIGSGKLHDTHGPWNYVAGPYAYYTDCNRNDSLLHSEVGAPSASRMELLHRYAGNAKLWPPTKNNRFWLTRGAWWLHMEPMAEWFGEFDGEVRDINTYVRAFRFTQAEALRYVVSAIRYAGDRKAGIIIWMGNEPFPNAANTSVLEFDGCPKPAYYELKRMYAPIMLGLRHDSIVAKDGTVTVTPFWRADAAARMQDAMVEVYDMQGKRLLSKSLTAADSPCDWDAIAVSVASPVLVRISSQEQGICVEYIFLPEGEHPFAPLLSLPKASVTAECLVDGVLLTNTGDAVALYCDLTVYGEDGSPLCAQDGNLCLLPGEQRFVRVEGGKRCALQPLNV